MRGAEAARRAGLGLGVLLLLLLIVEGGLRVFLPPAWLWPTPMHQLLLEHPTRLWTLRPNATLPLRGGHRLVTNSWGLRDGPLVLPAPDEQLTVLSLGESSTMGDWVAQADTYNEQLERLLQQRGQDARVINAGVGGWTLWQSQDLARELIPQLLPDLVLVYHQHNDLLPLTLRNGKSVVVDSHRTDREQVRRRRPLAWLLPLLWRSWLYLGLRRLVLQLPDPRAEGGRWTPGSGQRVPDADRWEALSRIQKLTEAHGAKLVIVQPTYAEDFSQDGLLERFANEAGVLWVDLPRQRTAAGLADAGFFFVDSVHPKPAGHAFIAQALLAALDGAGLLPPAAGPGAW